MAAAALSALLLFTAALLVIEARMGRAEAIQFRLQSARAQMAADTFAGYEAALEHLREILAWDEDDLAAKALTALVEAILFDSFEHDHGRLERAGRLLTDPGVASAHPLEVLEARYLAADARGRAQMAAGTLAALGDEGASSTLHYLRGRAEAERGELEAAVRHLRRALDISPEHHRAAFALAEILASEGRREEALTLFDRIWTASPGHVRAKTGAAMARLGLGEEPEALAAGLLELAENETLALAPKEEERLEIALARTLDAAGSADAAVERLDAAAGRMPESVDILVTLAGIELSRSKLEAALESARRALLLDERDGGAVNVKAMALIDWGHYEEASEVLGRLDPERDDVWLARAMVAHHLGDAEGASQLSRTKDHEPGVCQATDVYMALLLLQRGAARQARASLLRAAGDHGDQSLVEWGHARWHLARGNFRLARAHLENAVERCPACFRAHTDLARLAARGGALDETVAHLEAALAANRLFRDALLMLGEALLQRGEPDRARPHFEVVLQHRHLDPLAHAGMTMALVAQGHLGTARSHAEVALEEGRAHAETRHAMGRLLIAEGRPEEALAHLIQARRRAPDDTEILVELARAHLERGLAGDPDHARRYLRQALAKERRHAEALALLGSLRR